jgi:hypothetical protein
MKTSNLKLILLVFAFSCCATQTSNERHFEYILDMVHDNPGEKKTITKYNEPSYIKELGFDGMIPHLQIQTAIDYQTFDVDLFVGQKEVTKWITEKKEWIDEILFVAEKNDIEVYPFTDFMILPNVLLERYASELIRDEFLSGELNQDDASGFKVVKGKYAPDINKDLTQKLLRIQLNEIFDTFPSLDGLTVRFGETYLFNTPYHSGGSPLARGGMQGISDHVKFIKLLREEVCVKRDKKIFYRTWDFGFFHENPEVFKRIVDQIKPHPNLIFSIKHQQGDFHRMTPLNPTFGIGNHPYIVEESCQPEAYGKGAHPYYIGQGVINGWEEYSQIMLPSDKKGLKDLLDDPNFVGVWTWSRGGGWRGPYINNELWVDLNTQVILNWAQNPEVAEEKVFNDYVIKLGLKGENITMFRQIALLSAAAAVRGHTSMYSRGEEDLTPWWTRDHFIYGQEMIRPFLQRAIDEKIVDKVLEEKEVAVKMWLKIEELSRKIEWSDNKNKEYLMVSCTYGRIKYEIFYNSWKVLLLGMQYEQFGVLDINEMQKALDKYDDLWIEWEKLKLKHPQCATIYLPHAFALNFQGAYADKENGMQASINKYRKLLFNLRSKAN